MTLLVTPKAIRRLLLEFLQLVFVFALDEQNSISADDQIVRSMPRRTLFAVNRYPFDFDGSGLSNDLYNGFVEGQGCDEYRLNVFGFERYGLAEPGHGGKPGYVRYAIADVSGRARFYCADDVGTSVF